MPARKPHLTSSIDSTLAADSRDLTSVSVIVWLTMDPCTTGSTGVHGLTEEKSRSDCAELAEMQ